MKNGYSCIYALMCVLLISCSWGRYAASHDVACPPSVREKKKTNKIPTNIVKDKNASRTQ